MLGFNINRVMILWISALSWLVSIVSLLPVDTNKLDLVLDASEQVYDKVLYGEPVIFTGDEEFLQYVQDKFPKGKRVTEKRKHASEKHNKPHKKNIHHHGATAAEGKHKKTTHGLDNSFNQHTCGPVALPACRDLELYPLSQYPNVLGHADVKEAIKALAPYAAPMKDTTCGPFLRKFSCLLMEPQCTGTDEPLSPCQSVCQSTKEECLQAMKYAGLVWPKEWNCERFPSDGLCSDLDIHITPVPEPITKSKQRRHSAKMSNHVSPPNTSNQSPSTTQKQQPIKPKSHDRWLPRPRKYDIGQVGNAKMFQGWADVQGQGAANDYCRVIGTNHHLHFLSCTLGGSILPDHHYVSKRGFDVGHENTWFMRDMDGDGRDDYCRCVGRGLKSVVSCMKAGEFGFYGSPQQPGQEHTFTIPSPGPCFQRTVNPFIGIYMK